MDEPNMAEFRVVANDRDWRFPVIPEVTVDGGETWHPVPVARVSVHEAVDEATTIDMTVYHAFARSDGGLATQPDGL